MVGRVGYAPTTPAMSMQYSTIELTALQISTYDKFFFLKKMLVFLLTLYIKRKIYKNKVILKSEKRSHLVVKV